MQTLCQLKFTLEICAEQLTMSAKGHQQTFAVQEALFAITPKADISAAQINVR